MRWGSRRAAVEERERVVGERETALASRAVQVQELHEEITQRVSTMVLQAGAMESLAAGAGRDLDPEASRALTQAAAAIRVNGRQALAGLRLMMSVLPERQGKLVP